MHDAMAHYLLIHRILLTDSMVDRYCRLWRLDCAKLSRIAGIGPTIMSSHRGCSHMVFPPYLVPSCVGLGIISIIKPDIVQ